MSPSEQALASRLGLDHVRVQLGVMDGRTPVTIINLEGRVLGARWGRVSRAAAQEVARDWPDTADMIDVYLRHDPVADPFWTTWARAELVQ